MHGRLPTKAVGRFIDCSSYKLLQVSSMKKINMLNNFQTHTAYALDPDAAATAPDVRGEGTSGHILRIYDTRTWAPLQNVIN